MMLPASPNADRPQQCQHVRTFRSASGYVYREWVVRNAQVVSKDLQPASDLYVVEERDISLVAKRRRCSLTNSLAASSPSWAASS